MEEKPPTERTLMLAGVFWFVLSMITVLVWSYFSSEWWSPVFLFLAVDLLIASILHSPPIGPIVTWYLKKTGYYQKTATETKEHAEEPR